MAAATLEGWDRSRWVSGYDSARRGAAGFVARRICAGSAEYRRAATCVRCNLSTARQLALNKRSIFKFHLAVRASATTAVSRGQSRGLRGRRMIRVVRGRYDLRRHGGCWEQAARATLMAPLARSLTARRS